MQLASQNKKADFQSLLPAIKESIKEWQSVSVRMPKGGAEDLSGPARDIHKQYADRDGMIFTAGDRIIMLVRTDRSGAPASLKAEMEQKFPGKGYRYLVRQMTAPALEQFETLFFGEDENPDTLLRQRLGRPENRVLVIDDDSFYQDVLKLACEKMSTVYQNEDGKDAAKLYQEVNPDIVFLDIHLPDSHGQKLLEELLNVDFDAYVIMISADSSSQNVLQAINNGAAGFLKKPLETQKLLHIFQLCPSSKKQAELKQVSKG